MRKLIFDLFALSKEEFLNEHKTISEDLYNRLASTIDESIQKWWNENIVEIQYESIKDIDSPFHVSNSSDAHKCPYCGASYYEELYSTSTCMYIPYIVKDGKVQDTGLRNKVTTHCKCLECGNTFDIER